PPTSVRIAVIGRTELKAHLLSQAQLPASATALVSAKKSFTSRSMPCAWTPWWSRRETNCAKRSQCPGGSSERGPSAQYSAIIFCSSVRPALSSSSALAWARYSEEPYLAGPVGERSAAADESANGATCGHWAPTKFGVTTFPNAST